MREPIEGDGLVKRPERWEFFSSGNRLQEQAGMNRCDVEGLDTGAGLRWGTIAGGRTPGWEAQLLKKMKEPAGGSRS